MTSDALHPTLRELAAEEHLDRAGYQSFRVLDPEQADALRDRLLEEYRGERTGFHSSVESHDFTYRATVHEIIVEALQPFIDEVATGHQIINTALVVKWPGDDGVVPIHQDWTFVDETQYRTVNLYCALTPSNEATGGLRLVPGSHRATRRVRCSRGWPDGYVDPAQLLDPAADLQPLSFHVGEGAVLDNALVHASGPNRSDEPRVSVVVALAPSEAPLRHHIRRGDDEYETFAVDDPVFFRTFVPGAEPEGLRSLGRSPLPPATFTVDDLRALVTGPEVPPAKAPAPARPSPFRLPRLGRRRRATFKDRDLEQQFRRDGFVVVDLISPDEAAGLRAAYDHLDHRASWDSPFAEGFHTTIFDGRTAHRGDVLATIEAHLGAALDEVLVDHRMFFANFTVKASNAGPVPVHLDWTFVDEGQHRSATVWCALHDIDERNGALGVEVGSHLKTDFIRAVNRRDYDAQEAGGDGSTRRLVSLRAGQAIIMDNRSLHYSAPNSSAGLRVAATCVVAPRTADLHHYWVDDEDHVWRFTVDRRFYLSYTPGQLPEEAAGVLRKDLVANAVTG